MSENTLKSVKSKGINCWSFIKDPADKRKVLVEYEKLKEVYKQLVLAKYGNPYNYIKNEVIDRAVEYDYEAFKYYSNKAIEGKIQSHHIEQNTTAARWLNLMSNSKQMKKLQKTCGVQTKEELYEIITERMQQCGVKLPCSYPRLKEKLRQYGNKNYEVLLKNYEGNQNALKISEEAGEWLLAMYSLPTKITCENLWAAYNKEAKKRGWEHIKDSRTIYGYLHKPEIERLWTGPRHGFVKYAEQQYRYPLKTILPTRRDTLWYSDGTKLNFFDSKGKLKASYTVYEIIDVYSECLLGYHIAHSEDHIAQYHATKMAISHSGMKPYEWRYDNQGGHKKLADFFGKLSNVGFATRPYNGKSKTIESVFGRMQQQVMRKLWYFTGQNITARKTNSKANMEFVIANLKHLPTPKEMMAQYAECRDDWNNMKHPKMDITRAEAYRTSVNEGTQPVSYLDMVELFWLTNPRQIIYRNEGIRFENGGEIFEYEVLNNNKMPDEAFRAKHIGRAFTIKYDPADRSHIRLYTEGSSGLKHIAIAQTRITVHRAIQDYTEGEREHISKMLLFGNNEIKTLKKHNKTIEEKTGIRAEDLVNQTIGTQMKQESYEEDYDWRNLM